MEYRLNELLFDDYLRVDDENDENISISFDNERLTNENRLGKEKTSHDYLREIIHHRIYEYFMAFVVISSSITLGLTLETEGNSSKQKFIYALDEILIALLFLDFLLKIYVESISYLLNWTNLYDLIIILCGIIEIISNLFFQKIHLTITNLLKGLRLLQLIRLYRIIKLSEGLQILTRALINTVLTYTFIVIILTFLLIYIVAVAGQMLYGRPEQR